MRDSTRRGHSRGAHHTRIEPINPQRREVTLRRTFTFTETSLAAVNNLRAYLRSPRSTVRLLSLPLRTAVAQEQEVALPDSPRRAAGPGRASLSARRRPYIPRPPRRTTPAHHPRRLKLLVVCNLNLAHRSCGFRRSGPSRPRNPFRHKRRQQEETSPQSRCSTSPASIFHRQRHLSRRRKRSISPLRLRNVRRDLAVVPSKTTIQRSSTSPPRRLLVTQSRAWGPSNLGILRIRAILTSRERDGILVFTTNRRQALAFLLRTRTPRRTAANRQLTDSLVRSPRRTSMARPRRRLPVAATPVSSHRTPTQPRRRLQARRRWNVNVKNERSRPSRRRSD